MSVCRMPCGISCRLWPAGDQYRNGRNGRQPTMGVPRLTSKIMERKKWRGGPAKGPLHSGSTVVNRSLDGWKKPSIPKHTSFTLHQARAVRERGAKPPQSDRTIPRAVSIGSVSLHAGILPPTGGFRLRVTSSHSKKTSRARGVNVDAACLRVSGTKCLCGCLHERLVETVETPWRDAVNTPVLLWCGEIVERLETSYEDSMMFLWQMK